jgi:uncharacterized protein YybS (DUF2232 family)
MQGKERREILAIGALGAILSFAVLYFPVLVVLLPLMPLPYIYLLKKYGHHAGTLAIVMTAMINASYMGIVGLLISLATFGLIAVSVGGAFRENLKPSWTAMISIGSMVIAFLTIYYVGMRFGAVESIKEALHQSMPWERLARLGLDIEDKRELVNLYLAVMPGLFSGIALFVGLVDYYIFAGFLRKSGCMVERLKPMKEWAFPKWIAFGYIVLEFLPKDIFIINVQFALMAILMLEGFVLISFLVDRWGIHRLLRYTALLLIVPIFFMFLYLVGMIDAFFPIRKVNRWKFWEE